MDFVEADDFEVEDEATQIGAAAAGIASRPNKHKSLLQGMNKSGKIGKV